ncbi:MAG TPA: glycosyltransferase 87 family protein [Methylomirabilota bacterium]|nr:glycosyltransferase 87 family protein [Methylomirabilota bacterium]
MSLADARVRLGIAIATLALAATAVLVIAGWPGRSYLDSDYLQYYAGSRALIEGASPYDHTWWAEFHQRVGSRALSSPPHTGDANDDWTTPYPIPTFIALIPFALLPLTLAEPLFATSQVALLLGAMLALAAVVPRSLSTPGAVRADRIFLIAITAASQPLWVLLAGGNATGFAVAAFTFALAALLVGRSWLSGLLVAGILIKPHLFVLGALALFVGAPVALRARLAAGAAIGTLALVLPAFVLQPGWVGDWLRQAGTLQASSFSNATGWTIARPFTAAFLVPSAVVVVACVAALVVWWWRARPDLLRLVAGALPVSVLVAPHGWSYDYIALLPTLVAGVGLASGSRMRTAALGAVALLAVLVPWLLYSVAMGRNGEDLSAPFLIVAEVAIIAAVRPRS